MKIHQILKQHRLDLEYQSKAIIVALANNLGITIGYKFFNELENKFTAIPEDMLRIWLTALDIPYNDFPWFIQTHQREIALHYLTKSFPDKNPELLRRLADILTLLPDLKALKAIWDQAGAAVVENTLFRPRFVEIIIDKEHLRKTE